MPAEVVDKKVRKRKKRIYKTMAAQLEFYFSDANLRKSKFLKDLITQDPWVPLAVFEKFNKIKELLCELGDDDVEKHILKALEVGSSSFFEISEDKKKLKRATELKEKDDVEECTVYVENLPKETTHESLKAKFAEFGPVAYVSIPKFKNSPRIKGFAFVEFESQDTVRKVMDSFAVHEGVATAAAATTTTTDIPTTTTTTAATEISPASLLSVKAYLEENPDKGGSGKENQENIFQKRKHDEDEDDDEAPKRLRIDENVQTEMMKTECEDAVVHGLRVLTKTQWRRLRNRYLNEQRKNMAAAKALLRKRGSPPETSMAAAANSRPPRQKAGETVGDGSGGGGPAASLSADRGDSSSAKSCIVAAQLAESKGRTSQPFTPGVIVKISVESGIDDPKAVKKVVRELADVAYVDARIGQSQFYVRCREGGQAVSLAAAALPKGWSGSVIQGEEESSYWHQIEKDKEEKRSGKVVVPKLKSKKRLLAKVEAVKRTHVFFDE